MFKGEKNKSNNDSPERLNKLVSGTQLLGDLTTEGNLRVDGKIKGNTQCNGKFVLGDKGLVNGDLTAVMAELEGTVEGDIFIEDLLTLRKTAVVKGSVTTGRLVIEDGAQIGGAIQTGDVPLKKIQNNNPKSAKKPDSIKPDEQIESDIVY